MLRLPPLEQCNITEIISANWFIRFRLEHNGLGVEDNTGYRKYSEQLHTHQIPSVWEDPAHRLTGG